MTHELTTRRGCRWMAAAAVAAAAQGRTGVFVPGDGTMCAFCMFGAAFRNPQVRKERYAMSQQSDSATARQSQLAVPRKAEIATGRAVPSTPPGCSRQGSPGQHPETLKARRGEREEPSVPATWPVAGMQPPPSGSHSHVPSPKRAMTCSEGPGTVMVHRPQCHPGGGHHGRPPAVSRFQGGFLQSSTIAIYMQ